MAVVKAWWLFAVVAAGAGTARADDIDEPPMTFHKGQLGISARLAFGYRFLAPHDGNKSYCGVSDANQASGNASVCTAGMPPALDLEAAYGVAQHIELTLELRLGLSSDFGATPADSGPHTLRLDPGARFFFSEAKHAKLFIQPMLLADFTGFSQRSAEYGVRAIQGVWIDLHRAYGIYGFIGETAGFTPWLEGEFEGGFGFQGRYP